MIKQAALACLCIFVLYSDARSQEDAADGLPPVSTEEIYVRGQHLSYDPFFVLPNQGGYKAVNVGMRSTDTSEPDKRTNFFLMAKFTPSEGVEVGTQLEFGFLNETASNFSSLMVGSKYSLGAQRAASINLLMPAGDIKNPGISLGLMNSLSLSDQFEINKQFHIGFLKGYTGGSGIVLDGQIEPVLLINDRWVAYFDLDISSHTDNLNRNLAVNAFPNIDWVVSDGNALNLGVKFGLMGDLKSETTGLYLTLLRTM